MFLRSIHHLRATQSLRTLSQRLVIQTAIVRSYATLDKNYGKIVQILRTKENFCRIGSVCYLSQQPKLKEASETGTKYGFEFAMDKLESFYQLNGFIGIEQLKPIMEIFEANSSIPNLTHEQGLFLLNLCGWGMPSLSSDERISNFRNIWQYLQLQLKQITKEHYHAMLQVLQHNRSPLKDYRAFLQEYEKYNETTKEILPQLLAVAGASGNIKQSTEILTEMRSLELTLTEHDFNSLLLAHARANDVNGCQTVLEAIKAAGLSISIETQSTLIAAYMENGDETKAVALLQQFHGQFQFADVLKMLQSVMLGKNISQDFVVQLVKEFKPDDVIGLEVPIPLRRLCVELLYNGKQMQDVALSIIKALPTPVFQENQDIDTYGVFLLHAFFRVNCELVNIIAAAIQLEDSGKNSRALHIAAEVALKRNPPHAIKIFEALKARGQTLRPHYFWPLMMYNFRRHSEAGILRTLKIMKEFEVECDQQTIFDYVIPKLSIILTNPQMALKQLESAGVKTSSVLTPIISHLLWQNKWFEVAPLVEPYTTKINNLDLISPLCSVAVHVRVTKRYHHFGKLLSTLAGKHINSKEDFIGQFLIELLSSQARIRSDLHYCKRLVGEIQKLDIKISAPAVNKIQGLLTEANDQSSEDLQHIKQKLKEMTTPHVNLANNAEGDNKSSSFIKHPRDMSYDELECHLVELEAKHMNTRGVLRRLLNVCVRNNRLERAVEIKNKCNISNVHTSPGMLANILELYTKLGDLANAEKTLKTLQKSYPGFNVDEHKFIDYAALLVKCGQLENAKELLEERSLHHQIIGGDYTLKNVWNFLTNVAHLASTKKDLPTERNLTRETCAFLQNLGYCKTHNTILGPIVRERLLRGDVVAAVNEFKQLAKQYKQTPLQFELLSIVVGLCNGEYSSKYKCSVEEAQQMLAGITEIVTEIHGVVNMNSGLLLAFAESGSDNQLRRLLITPEFRINEEFLLRNCEHLGQEGAVNTLLRLAKGARGLNRLLNEQNIYNMLLKNFIKSNNHEAAIDLYNRIESDDELKVSQEFLRNLVQLLRTNNIEIPGNIALRAQIL